MISRNSRRVFALLQSILLQVQHFQAQEFQFYVEKVCQNQFQRMDPAEVRGCFITRETTKHNPDSNKK